jgi:hypothetical protein
VISDTLPINEICLIFTIEIALGDTLVPTPEEYWHRAEALVKLAALATQLYAREMLLERAAEFRRMAAHRPASFADPSDQRPNA